MRYTVCQSGPLDKCQGVLEAFAEGDPLPFESLDSTCVHTSSWPKTASLCLPDLGARCALRALSTGCLPRTVVTVKHSERALTGQLSGLDSNR